MVAEAEAVKGRTTINQKAIAIAAELVLVAAETAAAVAVAAAMATAATAATAAVAAVMAAPTWRRQWQRGRPIWSEVIFLVITIICMTVRTYVITIVRRMAKHKCVLIQITNVF